MSWYLDAMHVEDAQRLAKGEGVTVAVVDTGVDSSHPDLQGQVLPGGEVGDHGSGTDGKDDKDGHGTGMASLIAGKGDRGANSILGVAPMAKVLPVRIAQTSDGSFQPSDVYDGVRWAIDHGAKVVNMSLGGERSTDAPWKKQLVDYATKKNVVLIAAAGNTGQGDKRVAEPASIPGVVAVSGTTRDGTFWDGSAKGPEVVVSAPAEDLPMAVPRSVSSSGYALADGTSGATALVSGVAALIRSAFPDISANDVINRLIHTAEDHGRSGRDEEYGYGVVDARAALEGDVPSVDHDPLVSPEANKSAAPAAAAGGSRGSGNQALLVVGVFVGTALVLLAGAYLLHLARRSRQVVLAGVAPGVGPVQLAGGVTWGAPPGPQWTGTQWPGSAPPGGPLASGGQVRPGGHVGPGEGWSGQGRASSAPVQGWSASVQGWSAPSQGWSAPGQGYAPGPGAASGAGMQNPAVVGSAAPAPGYGSSGPPAPTHAQPNYQAMAPYQASPAQPWTHAAPGQPPLPGNSPPQPPQPPQPLQQAPQTAQSPHQAPQTAQPAQLAPQTAQPVPAHHPSWPQQPPSVWPAELPASVSAAPSRPTGSVSPAGQAAPAHTLQSSARVRPAATDRAQPYASNSATQQMPVISSATPPADPRSQPPQR
jgi:type VII secretion-associated serine protease mycosin